MIPSGSGVDGEIGVIVFCDFTDPDEAILPETMPRLYCALFGSLILSAERTALATFCACTDLRGADEPDILPLMFQRPGLTPEIF